MSTTCIVSASAQMISPIASAMRPETPVSISSKRMVGSCIRRASSALSASMTRDSSPPDAIRSTAAGGVVRFAEKRNSTRSRPPSVNAPQSTTAASKRASGIPSRTSVATICPAKAGAACSRVRCNSEASNSASLRTAPISACKAASSSSECVMASSCAA